MTTSVSTLHCPGAETIALLAEGRLDPSRLDAVLAHVESCRSCTQALVLASGMLARETIVARGRWRAPVWWTAAAALVLIAGSLLIWQRGSARREGGMETLVALVPRSVRLIEPRLSGGFAWAPYRGPMRAGGSITDSQRLRLGGAAADAIDRAERDRSPAAQHVAGVAVLLADDPLQAVERLRAASDRAPNDARIASDLAAARYSAAEALGRASLYPEALAAADRALRGDADLPEARFNRALILERLGLASEARRAWERYLARDSSSPWADEARRRLTALPKTTSESLFKDELPRIERDAPRIVASFPQQSRTYAEAEHLGQWGEAALRSDMPDAARNLAAARAVGDALHGSTGEALLHDAVSVIDAADPAGRAALARAHRLYRQGRIAYSRRQLDVADRDLAAAAGAFASARSPMALVARYYLASIRYDRHENAPARAALEAVLLEALPGYTALRAQAQWELALCGMYEDDWTATVVRLTEAETLFERLGERANLAAIRSLLATALMAIGRPEDAWSARRLAFEGLSGEGRGDRLLVSLSGAARMELRAGRIDAARALLAVEVEEARVAGSDPLLSDALARSALASEEGADHPEARSLAVEALRAASRISDPSLRARAVADGRAAEGVVLLADDPHRSIESLTAAIRFYGDASLTAFLPNPYLHRARAAMRLGNAGDALLDLERGIAAVERRPVSVGGAVLVSPVLDAGDSLFEEAIRLTLDRGDWRRAFEYAERGRAGARGAHSPAIDDLQRRLLGSGTVVLHLTALPDELVAFAVAANDASVARTPLRRDRLAHLTAALERGESEPLRELFDLLVRPSARLVDPATDVIVIAGRELEGVPFGALYDRQREAHWVESASVAVAVDASSLEVEPPAGERTAFAVALPSGERDATRGLPNASGEIRDIAALYARARVLAANDATYRAVREAARRPDTVIHIAGHTEPQRGEADSALRFRGGERATWTAIAGQPLDRSAVVVLAACETLRRPASPHIRSLSLGAAFAAAGAGNVIGTLGPIADADARELFLSIHRHLAAGASPAEAVRRAQLDAIASGRLPAWQSIELLTRCIYAPRARRNRESHRDQVHRDLRPRQSGESSGTGGRPPDHLSVAR
jgi:CHAT domain-containing protein/tetratricopeptide (TPR) repeat protein